MMSAKTKSKLIAQRAGSAASVVKSAKLADVKQLMIKSQQDVSQFDKYSHVVQARIASSIKTRNNTFLPVEELSVAEYANNPALMWAHDHSEPLIGNGLLVEKVDQSVGFYAAFANREINAFADMVGHLYTSGIAKAFSIGFSALGEWDETDPDGVITFSQGELQEVSAVNVGADPTALTVAQSAGIDLRPLITRFEQQLDAMGMAAVDRKSLERAWRAAGGSKNFVPSSALSTINQSVAAGLKARRVVAAQELERSTSQSQAPDGVMTHWQKVAALLLQKVDSKVAQSAIETATYAVEESDEIAEATKEAEALIAKTIDALSENIESLKQAGEKLKPKPSEDEEDPEASEGDDAGDEDGGGDQEVDDEIAQAVKALKGEK